jgi:hypothetical protein
LNASKSTVSIHHGSLDMTVFEPNIVHVNVAQGPLNLFIPNYGPKQPIIRAESTNGPVLTTLVSEYFFSIALKSNFFLIGTWFFWLVYCFSLSICSCNTFSSWYTI